MGSYGVLSILPPLIAIGLAIKTKQVYLSLMTGIWLGWTILHGWNPLAGMIAAVDALVEIFADGERTRIILVSIMIGALLSLTQYSGGMSGFVNWLGRKGLVRTRRAAGALAWGLGFFIFVESVIGVLVSGTITRPLFDKLKISREKLSYILDSTCAPKATILPLNTWGAYIIGLLLSQGVDSPVRAMVSSIPFNFYCILAIVFALIVAVSEKDIGPMKQAQWRVREEGKLLRDGAEPLVASEALMIPPKQGAPMRAFNMVFPVATVLATLPVVLWITGGGNMMDGSGTLAAFWSLIVAVAIGGLSYRLQGIMSLNEVVDLFMKGVGALIPVGVLLILAFGIGDVCRELGTGAFVARAAQAGLPAAVVPAALFLVSGLISFSTGTSYGTWAIMIPIAIPMIALMNLSPSLMIAAVLGGGIFGDHCSPISDSTIISSMAAATDHIDHVRTQLPYALLVAALTLVLYVLFGYVL
jgi:Na+/H+ antiporter NhaC